MSTALLEAPPEEAPIPEGDIQFDLSSLDCVDSGYEKGISRAVEIGKEHFGFFCRYFLRHHFDSDFGDFHIKLQTMLQDLRPGRHALFLLPREHGKSTLFNFAFILWNICYRKKRHIGIVSTTSTNAEKFLNKVQVELQNNDRVKGGFGDLVGTDKVGRKEKWRTSYIKTTNQVIVFTAGIGGSVRGTNESLPEELSRDFAGRDRFGKPIYRNLKSFRPDLILLDDVIEDKHIKTLNVREKLWMNWFWSAVYNTPEVGVGNIIIVGTTVHDDDLVMRLWKDKARTATWLKVRMPACDGFDKQMNPVNPLWPEKWLKPDTNRPVDRTGRPYTEEELQKASDDETFYLSLLTWKKIDLGTVVFAKEFLLQPLDDSQRYFKRDWFRYWINEHVIFTPAQEEHFRSTGIHYDSLPEDLIVVTSIDPAGSRGKAAEIADRDYTAIVTQGYSPSQRRYYLVAVDRIRASFATVMQLVFKHYVAYSDQYGGDYWPSGKVGVGTPIRDGGKRYTHLGFIVEAVAYQKVLADTINELSLALGVFAPVLEVKRGQRDKTARALVVSPIVERGQWYAPLTSHPELASVAIDACLDEMAIFPQGAHDDCVDGVVDGLTFLQKMSLNLNRGIAAQVAMADLLRKNPTMYAAVTKDMQESDTDMQGAMANYGANHPQPYENFAGAAAQGQPL